MTKSLAPPWPADSTVPPWTRRRNGKPRPPTRYRTFEDARTSDRYHVALYGDGYRQHLVIITEPGEHTRIPAWARTAHDTVKTYDHLWPFGYSKFRATIRYHLNSEDLVERRQD